MVWSGTKAEHETWLQALPPLPPIPRSAPAPQPKFEGRNRWARRRSKIMRGHTTCLGCGYSGAASLRLFHLLPDDERLPGTETRANTIPLCPDCEAKLIAYIAELGLPRSQVAEVWVTLFDRDLDAARRATRWLDQPRQHRGWRAKIGTGRPGWKISAAEARARLSSQAKA